MSDHGNRGSWLFDPLQYGADDNKALVHKILVSGVYQNANKCLFDACHLVILLRKLTFRSKHFGRSCFILNDPS